MAKTLDGQAGKPPGFGSNPTVGDPVRTRPRPATHWTPAAGWGDPVRSLPGRAEPPGAYPRRASQGGRSIEHWPSPSEVFGFKERREGGKGKKPRPPSRPRRPRARGVTLSGALPVPDHPRSPCRACCPSDDPRPRLHGRPTDLWRFVSPKGCACLRQPCGCSNLQRSCRGPCRAGTPPPL